MKILAILLVPLGLIAGLAGGHFLAPAPPEAAEISDEEIGFRTESDEA